MYGSFGISNFFSQYFLYILAFAIVMIAQSRVQAAYNRYRMIDNKHRIRGVDAARRILDEHGLSHVSIEVAQGGTLSDHFDPVHNVVRLSPDNYHKASIAAISVAAHECGHAIQHKERYGFIDLRNRLLPAANIASQLGWVVLVIGLLSLTSVPVIFYIGLGMICIVLLFQIVTLPVELNASSRAIKILSQDHLITDDEKDSVKAMLRAAAFTYVAAVLATIVQILRIVLMTLGRRRDD